MMWTFTYVEKQGRYVDAQGLTPFQRQQAAHRAARTQHKEDPRMLTKSASDVAWHAVYTEARKLVDAGKAADTSAAVDQLRDKSHPAYVTYLAVSETGSAPPPTADLAKRAQVRQEMQKRVDRLVRSGQAATADDAMRQASKDDPAFYAAYRKASYSRGGLPAVTPDTVTRPETPVWDAVRKMALALRDSDRQYADLPEAALVAKVFDDHLELHDAYRREVAR